MATRANLVMLEWLSGARNQAIGPEYARHMVYLLNSLSTYFPQDAEHRARSSAREHKVWPQRKATTPKITVNNLIHPPGAKKFMLKQKITITTA